MVYLYQHKTVGEYLFLIVKFISFNLLYFFPYSVKGENRIKVDFLHYSTTFIENLEKSSFLGKGSRVSSGIHSGTRHRSQWYTHFPSIQKGISQLAKSSATFQRGRDLTTKSHNRIPNYHKG